MGARSKRVAANAIAEAVTKSPAESAAGAPLADDITLVVSKAA